MIIDCHYHLERRLMPDDELLKKMDECGVDRMALMGVINEPFHGPPEFLLFFFRFALWHRMFRFFAKLMCNNFTDDGNLKLPTGKVELIPNPENEPVFEMVAKRPDRFYGWVFVNPTAGIDPVQELNKWKDQPGFVGVKAHPFWHRYPPAALIPVAHELTKIGKPLLIHVGFDADGDYETLLANVPGVKLILAHAGFPQYTDTWKKIKDNPNVYVDLSQSSYLNDGMTRQAVAYLGASRCLFGTDGPYGVHGGDDRFDYTFLKRRVEKLFPEETVQKKIFGENFLSLIQ